MEKSELIDLIKEFLPDRAMDITEGLELLRLIFNETNESIGEKLQSLYVLGKHDTITNLLNVSKELKSYEEEINNIIDLFDIEGIDEEFDYDDSSDSDVHRAPNYDDYYIDRKIEHTLYEDYTHTKPYGFRLNEYKIVDVGSWKELLVKTCEYLISIDEDKFLNFENMKSMNGKKQKYFSVDPSDLLSPRNVLGKIYIETNHNANTIRNRVIALLKQYNFKINDFKVYLNKDYSSFYEESKSE